MTKPRQDKPPATPTERAIVAHIRSNEGADADFPYLDSRGRVTVGPGFLTETDTEFAGLDLWTTGADGRPDRRATVAEKHAAYRELRIMGRKGGLMVDGTRTFNVRADRYAPITGLVMPESAIEETAFAEVRRRIETAKTLVGPAAWARLSDGQRAVLVDVEYATGKLAHFRKLVEAARKTPPDGGAMARESLFGEKDATGRIINRNWDRVLRNHTAATGKSPPESARALREHFRRIGETVPPECAIGRSGPPPAPAACPGPQEPPRESGNDAPAEQAAAGSRTSDSLTPSGGGG